ncbi:MAG: chromate transporter [Candidatus Gastranaerophilales bacterium]|nr:chromate transporter [Candidatus Gastranaerophilales bacterium]
MNVTFLNIFKIFFKIGAILLGGGYVIIPIMQDELIKKRGWIDEQELCDYYCVSQCLPGIIAINISILVGYKLLKFKGVIASILGMILSPFITILLIANILNQILHISFIDGIFWGVNLSVIILIYLALKEMWQKSITDNFSLIWFLLILILSIFKVSSVVLILSSIALGIIYHFLKEQKDA